MQFKKYFDKLAHVNFQALIREAKRIAAVIALASVISTSASVVSHATAITVSATESQVLKSDADSVYPATFKVFKFDVDRDLVYIVSSTGHIYRFYGIEDYQVDDYVSTIMGDNGTPEITDDYIISVRYSGFWDERTETEN